MANKIKVKLILELRALKISQREIARTRQMSQHSVGDVCKLAKELGVSYDDVVDKTDEDVYQMFYPDKYAAEAMFSAVDYKYVHTELKKTGVTLKLLWQEYKDSCKTSNQLSVGYTKFCKDYADYVTANNLTNHLKHKPGMVCEVDWSGPTMTIVEPVTGEIIKVYLFVATLPYSQYSYVEPCLDMKQDTWLKCNVNMFEFFGGSTVRITCDNLKTGVISHPHQGEIILNERYEDLGNHYLTAIIPAGVKKPKQKASVEGSVGKIATAIIAKLRNIEFHALPELKIAVAQKLKDFNDAPFQKREGSRTDVFSKVEKSHLRPLPSTPYEIAQWVYGHIVNQDCHVAYKTNRYSVPYKYVGKKVDLKITDTLIEVFFKSERLCSHKRLPDYVKYKWSTNEEHMPDTFSQSNWDDTRILKWAFSIGPCTGEVVNRIFASVRIKEQGYNSSLSVLKLSKTYGEKRLETACEMSLERVRSPRYRNLKAILSSNQDQSFESKKSKEQFAERSETVQGYVRGSLFYGGGDK
ncbi:IS21 family transposase [Fusibacter paucivorans]|uniref:IS21 family transposase n=1 Tax=Fusibacter paucivorans TaxID=76009 RepID=A0ABS5PUR9_9FIRM|nr:IS21 family transposase [Fusibacter paucivorans]MBS7528851.1 IS21 family transposase [Fusibacter paucivorans]